MNPDQAEEMAQEMARAQAMADAAESGGGFIAFIIGIVYLWVVVMMITSMMGVFVKANKPWWAALVPIYNTIVLLEIAGKPIWWIVLLFIPIVNLVFMIMAIHALVTAFGKDVPYTVGVVLLPVVFLPMLAFGPAQYRGVAA